MSPAMICSPATPADAILAIDPAPIVERARALIGTKFRLHGRVPLHGLDCVGLIAEVFGWQARTPSGYSLRGDCAEMCTRLLDDLAMRRHGEVRAGDIMLLRAGPMQLHLGIWSGSGLIHADTSARRVVEMPGAVRWPTVAAWFKSQER